MASFLPPRYGHSTNTAQVQIKISQTSRSGRHEMYRSLWVMSHVSTITSMYTIADVHLFVSNSEKKLQGILLHSTMNLKQNTLNIKCYYFNTSSYIRNYHVVCRITCMSYMPKKEAFWSRDYQRLTEHKINTNLHKHT